jgi:hypothetical protein
LKVSGGRWVDTTHLTQIQIDRSHVWKLDLRDAHGRNLTVDRSLLRRSPQVWAAFSSAVAVEGQRAGRRGPGCSGIPRRMSRPPPGGHLREPGIRPAAWRSSAS